MLVVFGLALLLCTYRTDLGPVVRTAMLGNGQTDALERE
jgi:hypothetical protein